MTGRLLFFALVLNLATSLIASGHPLGIREEHQATYTLTKSQIQVEYRIQIKKQGRGYSMSDAQYQAFMTRNAARTAKLINLAVNNQAVDLEVVDAVRDQDDELYHFTGKIQPQPGLNTLSLLNFNLAHAAKGYVTFVTRDDIRLPQTVENEPELGEINFTFGLAQDPPPQKSIYAGTIEKK